MIAEYMKSALERFLTYKLVSVLAIIGICVASATFVFTIAVGGNARAQILKDIQELGVNLVFVRGIRTPSTRVPWMSRLDLSVEDVDFLEKNVSNIRLITPNIFYDEIVQFGRTKILKRIEGTTADSLFIKNISIKHGRYIDADDVRWYRNVCVIDEEVSSEIFGQENPVGLTIYLGANYFSVIGVMNKKIQSTYFDMNGKVIIPISTLQRNRNLANKIDSISISAISSSSAAPMVDEIEKKLLSFHGEKNFSVWCQEVFIQQRKRIANVFQILMISLALISILVGGIGIMNVMLISVKDRTKEIGIRRAVGSTRRGIILQFLLEAIFLSIAGGLIGLLAGTFLAKGITRGLALFLNFSIEWTESVSPLVLIFAFLVSCAIGILSGLYPAIKASRIQPVEALRYE